MLKPTQTINEIEMLGIAKELKALFKLENANLINLSDYLYSKFNTYEFKEVKNDNLRFQTVTLPSGYEFEINIAFAKKVLFGVFEIDLTGDGNCRKQSLRYESLPEYMRDFIKFFRYSWETEQMFNLPQETIKGFTCLQNFIILWLKEHYYFTETYLEDQTYYTLI